MIYDKPNVPFNQRNAPISPVDNTEHEKIYLEWQSDVDSRIEWAMEKGKEMGLIKTGQTLIAVQGWKGGVGTTNTLRVLSCN